MNRHPTRPAWSRTSVTPLHRLLGGLVAAISACHESPSEPRQPLLPATASATLTIPPSLPSRCGFQLTGVAFDGTYYYVAEGQFGGNCLIRYDANGQFVDQTTVNLDMRGLQWVPALGKLTTRHYNGGIVAIDYPAGTYTVLANYRTGPDQYAPAVDPAGSTYWIINGANAEQHQLADNALVKTIAVAQDNPFVIGASDRWIYTQLGTSINIYSKATGYLVATQALGGALGCQGWGFGASANGDRLLYVAACNSATGQFTNMGGKGLTASCGRQLTGVAFDGTNYFVAEGQFALHNCISRFTADSQFIDQRVIPIDMRGLHYVPALGKLATRHYNGGIVGVDYATGNTTTLANYRTGPDQFAPATDPAGTSYWIINGSAAEEHRLTDDALLRSYGIATDNPFVIGVSDRWFYTVQGTTVNIYSKATGAQVGTQALASPLGCQGWGFGASPTGEQLLEVKNCGTASAQLTGMGGPGLTNSCGHQLTGVAFDGTYYYVAEGQFALYNCISRFTVDGHYLDQRVIGVDMRGLHYVPALGMLATRHYNGGIVGLDYGTGNTTILANYRTGPDQFQPAVDPDGLSYWIINGANAERHRLTDDALLASFAITTDDPFVIAASDNWIFTHDAASIHAYDKASGVEVAALPVTLGLGCQGWGFGAAANADRLLYVATCSEALAQAITPPPLGNTPIGNSITVPAPDPATGNPTPVSVTFASVTARGSTTASIGTIGQGGAPPAPSGFILGSPATYHDVQTTASYTGSLTVCVGYLGITFSDESQLRLLHGDGVGGWTDVTATHDTGADQICGVVSSLSPFLVAQLIPVPIPVTIDPGAYTGNWQVLGGVIGSGSGIRVINVMPGDYTVQIASVASFVIHVASDGTVTPDNPVAATGGNRTATFNTVAVAIDPGAFALPYIVYGFNAYAAGARTLALVPGVTHSIDVGAAIGTSTLQFTVAANGSVISYNPASATGGAAQLTFTNVSIAIDPVAYGGLWKFQRGPAPMAGARTETLVPGMAFGIEFGLGLGTSILYFDIAANGVVTSGNSSAAVGGPSSLTFRNSTIHVVPSTPSAAWGIHQVVSATGPANAILVPGLSFALTAPSAPGVFNLFALGNPCAITPTQFVMAGVTFTLACGPYIPPNTAPTVGTVSVPGAPQLLGTTVSVSVTFADAEAGDTHTAVVDWGDGTSSAGAVSESGGTGSVGASHVYAAPGSYTVDIDVTDNRNASGSATASVVVVYANTPASVWFGVKSVQDVGVRFDLLVEVLKNGVILTSSQLNAISGRNGFGRAVLQVLNATVAAAPSFSSGDVLGVRVSARIATGVSGPARGTARLWFGDAAANSRSVMFVNGSLRTYYLISGSALSPTVGAVLSRADVLVDRNVGGNPFKPFGTWTIVF